MTSQMLDEELGRKVAEALDYYRLTDGPAKGLIRDTKIDTAISKAFLQILLFRAKSYADIEAADRIQSFADDFDQLIEALDHQVWNGKMVPDGETGNLIPDAKNPRHGLTYKRDIMSEARKFASKEFVPKTPKLEHIPGGDPVKSLMLMSYLFGNVIGVVSTANAVRSFIENVHNSCGTPGARFRQICLWLLSRPTGGVGKGFLIECLLKACKILGLDGASEAFHEDGWVNPSFGLHTITAIKEMPRLSKSSFELLNRCIDRDEFHTNQKFGSEGMFRSCTNLITAANLEPYAQNSRRYAVVEYHALELEKQRKGMSDEEWLKYFPLWDDENATVNAIVELFRVMPFRSEHPDWEPFEEVEDEYGMMRKAGIPIPRGHGQILEDIKQVLVELPAHKERISPNGETSEKDNLWKKYNSSLGKLRPSVMVKLINAFCDKSHNERTETKWRLRQLLDELKSARILDYQGPAPFFGDNAPYLDWNVFADYLDGEATSALANTKPFEETHQQWQRLIEAEKKAQAENTANAAD